MYKTKLNISTSTYPILCTTSNRALLFPLLLSAWFLDNLRPAVAKVYIVSFRTHDDRRPSKFIVLADNMRSAITMAWEHGGADFQSRFDKSTAQAQEMKEGALRVL